MRAVITILFLPSCRTSVHESRKPPENSRHAVLGKRRPPVLPSGRVYIGYYYSARTCLVACSATAVGRGVGRRRRHRRWFGRRQRSVGRTSFNTAGSRFGAWWCRQHVRQVFTIPTSRVTVGVCARERRDDDDDGRGRTYCPETTRLRVIAEEGTRGEWRYPTGER